MSNSETYIRWFETLDSDNVDSVRGKNAALGEMIQELAEENIPVPGGFATTSTAYRAFVKANDLEDEIRFHLEHLDTGEAKLHKVGHQIRRLFRHGSFPEEIATAIRQAYRKLSQRHDTDEVDVAARSSATAEDLPEASFAGQQETFLNVTGEEELLEACRKCYASLFTDRAITYREEQGFDHMKVALSVGVQKMVRADKASAGVMFTIDTETRFPNTVVINAAWGLGDNVVQGTIIPDEYRTFKPLLGEPDLKPIIEKQLGAKEQKEVYATGGSATTKNVPTSQAERRSFTLEDDEILRLSRWAVAIEEHYDRPMDIEWAKDGKSGQLFIVQARPETVQFHKEAGSLKTYSLQEERETLLAGLASGEAIAAGPACVIESTDDIDQFEEDAKRRVAEVEQG
jgi:pyruvate,water dikinase